MKPSWKFRLFGEWKLLFWIFGGAVVLVVGFWALIVSVVIHFIAKWW